MTISSSPSLTWVEVTSQLYDTSGDGGILRLRLQLWRANSTGASTTVTITPGATPPGQLGIQVVSISGAGEYIANVGWDTDTAGDPAPSMVQAPDAASTVLGFFGGTSAATATEPTNYTELNEFFAHSVPTTRTFETVYDAGSAAQSATWSTTATFSFGFLVEIREPKILVAAAGSYGLTGTDVGLRAARRLIASGGSYSLTGADASLRFGRKLTASPGTYTITGTAAALRAGRRIVAEAGSYAITWTTADALDNAEIRRRSRLHQRRRRYGWSDYGTIYPGYGR